MTNLPPWFELETLRLFDVATSAREAAHSCDILTRLRSFLGKPATPAAFVYHPPRAVRNATKASFCLKVSTLAENQSRGLWKVVET